MLYIVGEPAPTASNISDRSHFFTNINNRQDACSTKSEFSCGVGILPARKRLIENDAISQVDRTFSPIIKKLDRAIELSPQTSSLRNSTRTHLRCGLCTQAVSRCNCQLY
ncbi:MAG: hypothetical protein EAZ09_11545 [Oscillatoriales cyanobacterium]|nr:MAG: hypothetical protein EAZ18_19940 [Oscillatoriales cyanobacterium]TAH21835.1 MAG: hypothetical protein EAZ09_11545 [Oscillatoriales cyanobacterium]